MSAAPTQEPTGLLPIRTSNPPKLPFRKSTAPSPTSNLDKPRKRRSGNTLSETLTLHQLRFVEYYMRNKSLYTAAKLAGYAESTCLEAGQLLNNPNIREEISKRLIEEFKEKNITNEDIFRGVARCAFSNVFDYIDVQPDGGFRVDLNKVPREYGYAIQELSYDAQGRPRIRLVDKKAAYELLGKFRLMGGEKIEHSGRDGAPLTIQALDRIVQNNVTINQNFINSPEKSKEIPVLEGVDVRNLLESPAPALEQVTR
jgi:phage terminase small subunit